ncbi:hypothetical protein BDZ94DRAFT_776469 [Collybia nuda]|uniref:Uncharacterized protein n=1 Tax=Collybia nuda TaxID=64659 RepID=A0A9P5YE28_9AGAR|nr:hypothetical protein BDZ94DRAFT_776469 [Collybia nuda]
MLWLTTSTSEPGTINTLTFVRTPRILHFINTPQRFRGTKRFHQLRRVRLGAGSHPIFCWAPFDVETRHFDLMWLMSADGISALQGHSSYNKRFCGYFLTEVTQNDAALQCPSFEGAQQARAMTLRGSSRKFSAQSARNRHWNVHLWEWSGRLRP